MCMCAVASSIQLAYTFGWRSRVFGGVKSREIATSSNAVSVADEPPRASADEPRAGADEPRPCARGAIAYQKAWYIFS